MTGRRGEKQITKTCLVAVSPALRVEPPECEQPIRHSGSREAAVRNLERNNSLLDTGSRHRLVRYDVRGGLQAFSAGRGQQGSR